MQPKPNPPNTLILSIFRPPTDEPRPARSAGQQGGAPKPSRDMRLREFFDSFVVVLMKAAKRSPRTIASYRESLAVWEALTEDPALDEITAATLAAFVARLSDWPRCKKKQIGAAKDVQPITAATARKHCTQLQNIIRHAGPVRPWNKQGADLIADPPYLIKPPAGDVHPIATLTLDQMAAIDAACSTAKAPSLEWIDAATWWRAYFAVAYQTALRVGSQIYTDWTWLNATRDAIHIPGQHYKGGRGRTFALNTIATRYLDSLRQAQQAAGVYRLGPFGDRVWHWPHDPDNEHHPGQCRWHNPDLCHLQRVRRKIFAAAGVDPSLGGFHSLRRANATNRPLVDLSASQAALGHGNASTTQNHYLGDAIAQTVVAGLPQPACWTPTP